MPSSMVHLLTAYKYNPQASINFFIGNLVPDAVRDPSKKHKLHFRDISDRLKALEEFANSMNLKEDINQGILLHLFLDYHWDSHAINSFVKSHKGEDWFPLYRNEITLATNFLFNNVSWAKDLWHHMVECPISVYENIEWVSKESIYNFLDRNNQWNNNNNLGPSSFFSPEFVEEFTRKIAIEFKDWINKIDKN